MTNSYIPACMGVTVTKMAKLFLFIKSNNKKATRREITQREREKEQEKDERKRKKRN